MPKPLATTKQPARRHTELIELFQRLGYESLEKAIEAQLKTEFYQGLLKRVEKNERIPEFLGTTKTKLTKTIENLITTWKAQQLDAWNLPHKAAPLLNVAVQSYQVKGESIPCYDVLYETNSGKNAAKSRITTRRRSLEVTLQGSTEQLDELSGRLVLSMLRD